MTFIDVLILSIVEGVTEFLPISSTAHLLIVADLLKLPNSDFLSSFMIFIQLGAIGAVVTLYFDRIVGNIELVKKLLLAFAPTAIIGLFLYPIIKNVFFGSLYIVSGALFIGGLILIIFESWHKKQISTSKAELENISYKQAFLIGLFQSIAVIPGVSRAGATIMGGLWLGLSRVAIVEFSFLLAIPTMVAATGYDLLKTGFYFNNQELSWLLLGFILSFLMALVAVKWLVAFIRQNDFTWFGVYRVVLAVLILTFLV